MEFLAGALFCFYFFVVVPGCLGLFDDIAERMTVNAKLQKRLKEADEGLSKLPR